MEIYTPLQLTLKGVFVTGLPSDRANVGALQDVVLFMDSFFAFALIPLRLYLCRTGSQSYFWIPVLKKKVQGAVSHSVLKLHRTVNSVLHLYSIKSWSREPSGVKGGFWFSWGQIKASEVPCWSLTCFFNIFKAALQNGTCYSDQKL